MEMNHIRRGSGKPLLLIHGIGGSWRSWQTILDGLAATREVIAVDLPGFGDPTPLDGEVSIRTPSWDTYASLLEFAEEIRRDLRDLRPRDMIDIQSFI